MTILWVLLAIHATVNLVVTPITMIAEESKKCQALNKPVRIRGAWLEIYCEDAGTPTTPPEKTLQQGGNLGTH